MVRIKWLSAIMAVLFLAGPISMAVASESTMPETFKEVIEPDMAGKYKFIEDGQYATAGLPTYEWMPVDQDPKAIIVAIHGLTLHGRRFRVLGRSLAVQGIGFISMDMRGFGRAKFDDELKFSTAKDDKTRVNHEKSYEEIIQILTMVRKRYPTQKIAAMGESLGCTFCVRIAAEHPELIDGIVLSAPAVKVNSKMYASPSDIKQGIEAALSPHHEVNLHGFITDLVSSRPEIVAEMIDDPYIIKKLPISALLSTDEFVGKTSHWGKLIKDKIPVLILQGSADNCVSPKHVTDLMNNIPSDDQTLAWRGNYGHLQLETVYLRAATLSALLNWLQDHSHENKQKLITAQEIVNRLGGQVRK